MIGSTKLTVLTGARASRRTRDPKGSTSRRRRTREAPPPSASPAVPAEASKAPLSRQLARQADIAALLRAKPNINIEGQEWKNVGHRDGWSGVIPIFADKLKNQKWHWTPSYLNLKTPRSCSVEEWEHIRFKDKAYKLLPNSRLLELCREKGEAFQYIKELQRYRDPRARRGDFEIIGQCVNYAWLPHLIDQ